MNDLVSVIIPTYNASNYVTEAVESVLNQTYNNVEIIVVDDGSSDGTEEKLRLYQDRISYYYKTNGGPASARNLGIQHATGKYIAFLDADDIWHQNKIKLQLNNMHAEDGMIGSPADIDENKSEQPLSVCYETLLVKNQFCNSSVLVKKECFDKLGKFDERDEFKAVEDWDMWLRIASEYPAKSINRKIVDIRPTESSISAPSQALKMLNNEKAVLKKHLSQYYPLLKRMKIKNGAYSYRYFCAAWGLYVNRKMNQSLKHILISFYYNPLSFFNRKQGALMLKIIIKKILSSNIPVNVLTKPLFKIIYNVHVFVREAIICIVKFFYYEPLFRSQCTKIGEGLWMEDLPYMVGKGDIHIGDNVRFSGKPYFTISNKICRRPKVAIDDCTFVGHNVRFACAKEITVGKNCYIAGGVVISDNDGHPISYIDRRKNSPPNAEGVKPVNIGNDVWIARDAVILKGVKIGDRAIIGARAVVTKDVNPDTIVAGNPSQIIKEKINS